MRQQHLGAPLGVQKGREPCEGTQDYDGRAVETFQRKVRDNVLLGVRPQIVVSILPSRLVIEQNSDL
jgi:hypothetical protein